MRAQRFRTSDPIGCPETSVTNFKSTLHKTPENKKPPVVFLSQTFSVPKLIVLLQTLSLIPATSPFNGFYFFIFIFFFYKYQISINFSWSKGGALLLFRLTLLIHTLLTSRCLQMRQFRSNTSVPNISQSINQSRDTLRPEFSPWEITVIKTRS